MRYFFHLKRAGEVISDCSGEDLADVTQAHAYGVRMAGALLRHLPELRDEPGWYIAIARAEGRPILSIMLASVDAHRPAADEGLGLRRARMPTGPLPFDLFGYDRDAGKRRREPAI